MSSTGLLVCGLASSSCSLGSLGSFSEHAVVRYVSHFGPLNRVVQITAKYRLVIVDAPSLVDEDEERKKHGVLINDWSSVGGPVAYIKGLSRAPGEAGKSVMTSWLLGLPSAGSRSGGYAQHFVHAHTALSSPWIGLWAHAGARNHQSRERDWIPEHSEP